MRKRRHAGGSRETANRSVDLERLRARLEQILGLIKRAHDEPAESAKHAALLAGQQQAFDEVLETHAANIDAFLTAAEKARERVLRAVGAEITIAVFDRALAEMRNRGAGFDELPQAQRHGAALIAASGPTKLGDLVGNSPTLRLRGEPRPEPGPNRDGYERIARLIGALLRGEAGAVDALASLGCDRGRLRRASSPPIRKPSAMRGHKKRARALAAVFLDVDERELRRVSLTDPPA